MLWPHVAMLTVLAATAGPLYAQSGAPDETRHTILVGAVIYPDGRVSRDLHATSVMLDFFDRHPLQ